MQCNFKKSKQGKLTKCLGGSEVAILEELSEGKGFL